MNAKGIISKAICVIVLLLGPSKGHVCRVNASAQTTFSSEIGEGNLMGAFTKLSKLETFEQLNAEQLGEVFPAELGEVNGLIAPNADLRNDILSILSEIPYTLLYSEERTENDKIGRCYIEQRASGKYQMLFIYVGLGTNDVVAALFSGAPLNKYEQFGDSLKPTSFAEVEEAVVKTNAECPIVVGAGMEMTSTAINDRFWTIRMKINTFGKGLSLDKEQVKTVLKGISSKYHISQVFNLNIAFRIVYISETGETATIILEHEDLAEILCNSDVTTDDVLETYITNNKNACPLQIENGMSMTDVVFIGDVLFHVIAMDESIYSMQLLGENNAVLKQNLRDILSSGQDQPLDVVAEMLADTNKGLGYLYLGKESGRVVVVILTAEELKALL